MISKIIDIFKDLSFDFREYASPEDELSYLFEEWTSYYRMKYAICKAINPNSAL